MITAAFISNPASAFAQTVYFVRQVSSPNLAGLLSSVPSSGPASAITNIVSGISEPLQAGIAFNQIGTIFYSDSANNQILSTNKSGAIKTVISSSAGLSIPTAITIDQINNFIYIADSSNGRIVRANLNQELPITNVEVFVGAPSAAASSLSTLVFNPRDSNLYWTDSGQLYRAPVSSNIPINTAPPILVTQAGLAEIGSFDFDNNNPQNIYFISTFSVDEGIYRSPVPPLNSNQLNEVKIYAPTMSDPVSLSGLVISRADDKICYSGDGGSEQPFLRCGDISQISSLPTTLMDTGNGSIFSDTVFYMAIENPFEVRPDTKPAAPEFGLILGGKRPAVRIRLQPFSGADTKKTTQAVKIQELFEEMQSKKKKRKVKIGFRYRVDLKKTTDADGNKIKKKQRF